jgi:hypothetical protein
VLIVNFTVIKNHRRLLVIGLVGFFAFFALWLRLLPMFAVSPSDILSRVASDNPYPMKAAGPYPLEGTSATFEVPESAVMQEIMVESTHVSSTMPQEHV